LHQFFLICYAKQWFLTQARVEFFSCSAASFLARPFFDYWISNVEGWIFFIWSVNE